MSVDRDEDGVPDAEDNCPDLPNPAQTDAEGILCAEAPADQDGDGHPDAEDNCPDIANPNQEDADANGVGDVCDTPLPPDEPCLALSVEGEISLLGFIGGVTTEELTIQNCARAAELEVTSVKLLDDSDEDFFLDALPRELERGLLVLLPGESATFNLNYAPVAEVANEATLEIRSNDATQPELMIPIQGTGSNNACPTAVAKGREVGTTGPWSTSLETPPLRTIAFDGSDSVDPDDPNNLAAITGYEWTIVERPADSTAQLLPNARSANPQLFLDLAGRYVVQLRVYDTENTPSCETSEITILAVPNRDIQVEIVWRTPNDPDQTDTGVARGSDMDLHFLNPDPRAVWNASPWDCYWLNREPNWGPDPSNIDDPSFDIDDTDGAGPEVISLSNPENLSYRVGVHYFYDHDFGPSYVSVRIYLRSVLVFEYNEKYMEHTGQFWEVGTVEWPSGTVNTIDRVLNGFP